jgi:predicted small lipoprotein YifL
MQKTIQWIIVAVAISMLTACGGGGIGDTNAPIFTSPATVAVAENQTSAITLKATDESTITYGLKGGDAYKFNIDSTTGVVTFKTAPDFETKDTYSFTATATDSAGNEATQIVTINIIDLPEGQLKKTGQLNSYDEKGNEVTDGSIKDDGYYQTGVTPSYTRDDDKEIVTDHITGLMWQDNKDTKTVTKQWLTNENNNTSSGNARTYCSQLALGGYSDWRLPTIDELMYIVDRSKQNPAIDTTVFENIVSSFYWSSSTVVSNEKNAWGVYFRNGDDNSNRKSSSYYVRCVRVGE